MTFSKSWQETNLNQILQRLHYLNQEPDGILFRQICGSQTVAIKKIKSLLMLFWVDSEALTTDLAQSILDLHNPLNLVCLYTQALLLALVWQRRPQRIYTIGFGGGTLPRFLHHYFPEVILECTDTNPIIGELAQRFFGIQFDERLRLEIQDGREYLANRNRSIEYDTIVVDADSGNGYTPYPLVTQDFFEICQTYLSKNGVLAINLFHQETFNVATLKTLQQVFSQVYVCPLDRINRVALATNSSFLNPKEILLGAEILQDFHHFSFPLIQRALQLKPLTEWSASVQHFETVPILRDRAEPANYRARPNDGWH